ncbi:LysR family transcriptional regulator [Enterococcus casseliflavus]|uniref:LysR family transcriptional regulator n=1 Tax=Enterococcus casseliflavus TaxID=37734 RepID=UPI003EE39653
MNIQQMRIVQAIADHGSFREAAKRLYLSQPSLSQAVKELETELEVQLFERTNQGARLTAEGSEFLDHAQPILSQVAQLQTRFSSKQAASQTFAIASQHYDFTAGIFSELLQEFPDCRQFRLLETTTLKVITDVQQYRSEFGVLYLNEQNQAGLERLLQGAQLSFEALGRFRPHVFLRGAHPLTEKTRLSLKDLAPYPQVRFLQEDERYSFFSEDLIDFAQSPQVVHVSDRGTMVQLLQQTDLYGTGSGIVAQPERQGLAFLPLIDASEGEIILIKKNARPLSMIGERFLTKLRQHLAAFPTDI